MADEFPTKKNFLIINKYIFINIYYLEVSVQFNFKYFHIT